eukprot:1492307-Pyramimonas_sp.AAC.1
MRAPRRVHLPPLVLAFSLAHWRSKDVVAVLLQGARDLVEGPVLPRIDHAGAGAVAGRDLRRAEPRGRRGAGVGSQTL